MVPTNSLYAIWDDKNKEIVFDYRTGAGNLKKALFNKPRYAEKAIRDICIYGSVARNVNDFKVVRINEVATD